MSAELTRRWRDRLRELDPAACPSPLSAPGLRQVWSDALDALDDTTLQVLADRPGTPWASAAMAVPRTVPTSPIEWCAAFACAGTRVVLKPPAGDPGLVPLLVAAARDVGLPLSASDDRAALSEADLCVVQGHDASVEAVRRVRGARPTLGFGHRFSVAWVRDPSAFAGIARDAACFDGRGCMSPVAVFTDLPASVALDALAEAAREAEARWPRGRSTPIESAVLREHRARARATGELREGPGYAILHGRPADEEPVGLVRALHLTVVRDRAAFLAWCAPHVPRLSTIGSDDPAPGSLPDTIRWCAPGEMQRPPLLRTHDGVDWVSACRRPEEAVSRR